MVCCWFLGLVGWLIFNAGVLGFSFGGVLFVLLLLLLLWWFFLTASAKERKNVSCPFIAEASYV